VAAIAIADLSATGIKALVGRARPPVHDRLPKPLIPVPHDASFPSGHAATSFAAAAVLAHTFPRLRAPLFLLAAAVAFSRVYVGVHYPLDVVGGAVLGVLVATALRLLAANPPRSRRATPAG
jgi:undecaprenyl-diphosphatase